MSLNNSQCYVCKRDLVAELKPFKEIEDHLICKDCDKAIDIYAECFLKMLDERYGR